jgi:hypothetical protein
LEVFFVGTAFDRLPEKNRIGVKLTNIHIC